MTVGSGSPSASAAALTAMLDEDSGYGSAMLGNTAASSTGSEGWHPELGTNESIASAASGFWGRLDVAGE